MATQNEQRPTNDYTCAQAELYAGLETAWNSQAEHEAEFIAENTTYTAGLSVTRLAAIAAAQALPDGQARGAEAEVTRITLVEKLDVVLGKWNSLDGYIHKAFTGAYYKPRIEEAGKQYYLKATEKNWEYVKQLLVGMKNFLTAHGAVLVSDGGMPPTFAASVDAIKTTFDGLYTDFKDAEQDSKEQTDTKIEANNAIYKEGRKMMEDGKHIFRKNAAVRDRFVWERILELITPPSGGSTVIREGELVMGAIKNIDLTGVDGTDETGIAIEATDSMMRFYTSSVAGGGQTGGAIDVQAGQVLEYTGTQFGQLLGFNAINKFLNVQNVGMVTGQWKLKATHVE